MHIQANEKESVNSLNNNYQNETIMTFKARILQKFTGLFKINVSSLMPFKAPQNCGMTCF